MNSSFNIRTSLLLGFIFLCFSINSFSSISDETKLTVKFKEITKAGSSTDFIFEAGEKVRAVYILNGSEVIASSRVINQKAVITINFKSEGQKELRFYGDTYDNGYTKELLGRVQIIKGSQSLNRYVTEDVPKPSYKNVPTEPRSNVLLASYNGIGTTPESWNFINQISPYVVKLCQARGLPASVIVAMASLESQYGSSPKAREHNNLFGLKDKGYQYSTTTSNTACKDFKSFEDCLSFFIDEVLLHKTASWKMDYSSVTKIYQQRISAGQNKDDAALELIENLIGKGYAELDKNTYVNRIKRVVDTHNLRRLDNFSSNAINNQQAIDQRALYPRKP